MFENRKIRITGYLSKFFVLSFFIYACRNGKGLVKTDNQSKTKKENISKILNTGLKTKKDNDNSNKNITPDVNYDNSKVKNRNNESSKITCNKSKKIDENKVNIKDTSKNKDELNTKETLENKGEVNSNETSKSQDKINAKDTLKNKDELNTKDTSKNIDEFNTKDTLNNNDELNTKDTSESKVKVNTKNKSENNDKTDIKDTSENKVKVNTENKAENNDKTDIKDTSKNNDEIDIKDASGKHDEFNAKNKLDNIIKDNCIYKIFNQNDPQNNNHESEVNMLSNSTKNYCNIINEYEATPDYESNDSQTEYYNISNLQNYNYNEFESTFLINYPFDKYFHIVRARKKYVLNEFKTYKYVTNVSFLVARYRDDDKKYFVIYFNTKSNKNQKKISFSMKRNNVLPLVECTYKRIKRQKSKIKPKLFELSNFIFYDKVSHKKGYEKIAHKFFMAIKKNTYNRLCPEAKVHQLVRCMLDKKRKYFFEYTEENNPLPITCEIGAIIEDLYCKVSNSDSETPILNKMFPDLSCIFPSYRKNNSENNETSKNEKCNNFKYEKQSNNRDVNKCKYFKHEKESNNRDVTPNSDNYEQKFNLSHSNLQMFNNRQSKKNYFNSDSDSSSTKGCATDSIHIYKDMKYCKYFDSDVYSRGDE